MSVEDFMGSANEKKIDGRATVSPPVVASASAPSIRVLFDVLDASSPEQGVVYLSDGLRVVDLPMDQCRPLGGRLQCLYHGAFYDGVGFVEGSPERPKAVAIAQVGHRVEAHQATP